MTRRVVAVTPTTPFRDVVDLMLQHEISAVPVLDDEGLLIGMVSEADLIGKQAYGGSGGGCSTGSPGSPGTRSGSSSAAGVVWRARS